MIITLGDRLTSLRSVTSCNETQPATRETGPDQRRYPMINSPWRGDGHPQHQRRGPLGHGSPWYGREVELADLLTQHVDKVFSYAAQLENGLIDKEKGRTS